MFKYIHKKYTKYETCAILHRFHIMRISCSRTITSILSLKFFFARLTEEKRGDIVFCFPSFCPLQVVGTLFMQLLLQFYLDSFETLQVFRSWSENVHIVWIYLQISCHFFHKMNLVIFPAEVNRYICILCMQLLLQFYSDSFETWQAFRYWSENTHIVWTYTIPQIIFVIFFTKWT